MTPEQKQSLEAPLSSSRVKERTQAGRKLSYIEGWWAIAEANRIFGFDGWTRETLDLRCVSEKTRKLGQPPRERDGWGVTYIAKVRVTGLGVVREGCGTGHGIDADLGQAHESALKEAETDAMKRALMTFGNPFGLALYDKEQVNVVDDEAPASEPKQAQPAATTNPPKREPYKDDDGQGRDYIERQMRFISACKTQEDVQGWVESRAGELQRLRKTNLGGWNELREFKEKHIQRLIRETEAA